MAAWRRPLALAIVAIALSSCKPITTPDAQVGDRLAFLDQPTEVTAGLPINPAIRVAVLGKNGEPVVSYNGQEVTLQLLPTNARDSLKGQPTSVFVKGVAVFTGVSIDRTATGLRLAAISRKLTGVLSQPFSVVPGPPAQLKFITQPTDVVAGEPITPAPVVEVQDAKGNRTPSFSGAVTVGVRTGRSAEIVNNTVNCVDGLCTFPNLKLLRAAVGYTLAATTLGGSTVVTAGTSGVFEVKAGPASRMFFRQQPFNNLVNAIFDPPIRVEAVDTLDNVVTSATPAITLSFSNNPTGATLGGTLVVTAQNGSADFRDISVNKAGVNYRLQAAASGLSTAVSAFFSIVASGALREGDFAAPSDNFLREPRRETGSR